MRQDEMHGAWLAGWLLAVRQVLALIRKELLALFKEPANRIILFVPALLQALLYGYAGTYDLHDTPYAVLDQSRSEVSARLLARIESNGLFRQVATLADARQIADVIDEGRAMFVVSIPADFADRLAQGQTTAMQLILDGRNSVTAGLASGYVSGIVGSYNQTLRQAAGISGTGGVQIEWRAWFNPNLESRWSLMPTLIASLSLIQTLLLAALSVAREREQGTFDQLLVTPLTPMQILVGKAVPSVLVGLMQSTIILLIIRFWFQIPMAGSIVTLYLGLLVFTVAAVGVGLSLSALSLSALSLTMQQAMLYTFLVVMPLMMLSGMLTPVRNMPEVLQVATYANPLRFGVAIARGVYLEGATLVDIVPHLIPLGVMIAVTLPLAAWLFRHRLG